MFPGLGFPFSLNRQQGPGYMQAADKLKVFSSKPLSVRPSLDKRRHLHIMRLDLITSGVS